MSTIRFTSHGHIAIVAIIAIVFCTAPTVGDIGGCNEQATPMDQARFGAARKITDCNRCTQCGIATQTCKNACDPMLPSDVYFPPTCFPLLHDGEVCIDALEAASCSTYATYVADLDPAIPPECDFCQVMATPAPTFSDGGM